MEISMKNNVRNMLVVVSIALIVLTVFAVRTSAATRAGNGGLMMTAAEKHNQEVFLGNWMQVSALAQGSSQRALDAYSARLNGMASLNAVQGQLVTAAERQNRQVFKANWMQITEQARAQRAHQADSARWNGVAKVYYAAEGKPIPVTK